MDDHRRAIERRSAMTGQPDDEARLLAARLRAGDIVERSVMLAAAAGIKPANLALGIKPAAAKKRLASVLPAPSNPDLFLPIVEQVQVVWKLNKRLRLGFTAADFAALPVPLVWSSIQPHNLAAIVLVPYLDTVFTTFEALWRAVETLVKKAELDLDRFAGDPDSLRLLEGISHPGRCLRWEAIDLAANWEPEHCIEPNAVRNAQSAHAGVLAAAAIHTVWAKAINWVGVPNVVLAGYECRGEWSRWNAAPWMIHLPDTETLLLSANSISAQLASSAVPALLETSVGT